MATAKSKRGKRKAERRPPKPSAGDSPTQTRESVHESLDDWLTDARSILECAALCLYEMAAPGDPDSTCELSDVTVLMRLGIELVARAKATIDLCDVGGAA